MSETERRMKYYGERVLIDTGRILDPQFDDTVIAVTGAHLELMRNLMMYLNRRDTFVSSYSDAYYLMPTDADWDSLRSIIASLEERLMGNENVIWGYSDQYVEREQSLVSPSGANTLIFSLVPAGEIWVITHVAAWSLQSDASRVTLYVSTTEGSINLRAGPYPTARETVAWQGKVILVESEGVKVTFYDCATGNDLIAVAAGYKMKVPE